MKKRDIVVMLLLWFITCGIYSIFWAYLARKEFKELSGYKEVSPGLEVFLMIICFPYVFYWLYLFSSQIARYQAEKGLVVKDNSLINLILAIFGLGIVSELLIQDQLNHLD